MLFVAIAVATLAVGVFLHLTRRPGALPVTVAGVAALVGFSIHTVLTSGKGRPTTGSEFSQAVAWKLAGALPGGSGTVLVLQEKILAETESGIAERRGFERGVESLDPVFKPIDTAGQEGSPVAAAAVRGKLLETVKDHSCVAVVSLTPLARLLDPATAEKLPPLYLMELEESPMLTRLMNDGKVEAAVLHVPQANMATPPTGKPARDFDLRFRLVRPE